MFARYSELVDAVLSDQVAFAESIDDPEVRAGAEAYARGVQLLEQIAQLAYVGVPAVVVPGADVVGELSRLGTEVQQGLDTLVADTAGTPYEEAATSLVGEIEASGLLDAIGPALAGEANIGTILSAARRWPELVDDLSRPGRGDPGRGELRIPGPAANARARSWAVALFLDDEDQDFLLKG